MRITRFVSLFLRRRSTDSDDEVDEEVERRVDCDEGVRDSLEDLDPPGPLHVAEAAAGRSDDLHHHDDDEREKVGNLANQITVANIFWDFALQNITTERTP